MSDATTGNGSQSQATPQPQSPVGGPPTGRVAPGGTGGEPLSTAPARTAGG
jgi:hypothetical protein